MVGPQTATIHKADIRDDSHVCGDKNQNVVCCSLSWSMVNCRECLKKKPDGEGKS